MASRPLTGSPPSSNLLTSFRPISPPAITGGGFVSTLKTGERRCLRLWFMSSPRAARSSPGATARLARPNAKGRSSPQGKPLQQGRLIR
ncbi:hypothetical protein BMW22_40455 (plasmid) [Rhizobium leguminosarum]|uniref:Uncharacterized protein n=1 Tax=Rhizobium leguminosarum TaxID=384 RepID=A0A1L3ZPM6_RHILE|nr:hypothetical protein BMW22_40455 [Rhizobium leguminosarum]